MIDKQKLFKDLALGLTTKAKIKKELIEHILEKKAKKNIKPSKISFHQFLVEFAEHENTGFSYDEFFYTHSSKRLEEFSHSSIPLLIMEAPPRTGKTEIILMYILYLLCNESNKQFLLVFGSGDKKTQVSFWFKENLRSDYITSKYGSLTDKDLMNNQTQRVLSNGNSLLFKTAGSRVPTGAGFHYMVFIDYLTASDFNSTARRRYLLNNVSGFLTREQHKPQTKIILDNQRLGREDLTEAVIDNYNQAGLNYSYVQFPYTFKEEWSAIDKRSYDGYIYDEGEYLISRFDDSTYKRTLANIGVNTFKVQYQGIVDGVRGEIIRENDICFYTKEELQQSYFTKVIITVDTALKPKTTSDFTVISLWAYNGRSIFLIDMVRGKWSFPKLENQLTMFLEKWKEGVNRSRIERIRIEDNSTGSGINYEINSGSNPTSNRLREVIKEYNIKLEPFNPKNSKYERMSPRLHFIQTHKLYIPNQSINNMEYSTVLAFKQECLEFTDTDTHLNDDMVDTLISAMEYMLPYKRETLPLRINRVATPW